MILPRTLNLLELLKKKSFFLFGPRAVGKSFLIHRELEAKAFIIDLLNTDIYLKLSQNPNNLEDFIASQDKMLIVIDEVQKIPDLLNEVHRLIESKHLTFLLTGSSARKLKRGQANMLAGRAREAKLLPLTYKEITGFDLEKYLNIGGLPAVYLSDEPKEDLQAYIHTYLREEIQAEALVRNLPAFSRFLEMSALTSGNIMNFTKISQDTGIPATSIREYYFALEDTFIGFMLQPYTKTQKRKAISTAKFYYFDLGVRNFLARTWSIPKKTSLYGMAFEHFIAMELRAYLSYKRKLEIDLRFWQEKNGKEVDFILGDVVALEVKSTDHIQPRHLTGLKYFMEEKICQRNIIISFDTLPFKKDGIESMHWESFLQKLWNDEII
jgi:predicted AAA+ superfamily ATPase